MQKLPAAPHSRGLQSLDRVAITVILVLSLLIGALLWTGGHSAPRVRDFSWQDKHVGAEDTAFVLTFSRPMNHASVEENLRINPPLPGKMSWAGRRMSYTLTLPAPYGTLFQLQLQGAKDRFIGTDQGTIEPFTGRFQTRERAFVYIGVSGEEAGRLVLYNLTQQKQTILTPKNLVVLEFKPYPLGDRILFSATERTAQQGLLEQKLYTVTTGIQVQPPPQLEESTDRTESTAAKSSGEVELVLNSDQYQNLKFDLSPDGRTIVVQRVNRTDPADFGPWILRSGAAPQPLKGEPGGDFLITPDSDSLAISQGQGLAILPLQPDAKPLDFLPKFGMVLSFARDGSQAAMVKFNTDRTRSLFLVTSQGVQKEILKTTGSILNAQFSATKQTLYCLLTDLQITGELYREIPYLAAIDLKTNQLTRLLVLPEQRDVQVSLAPDNVALLFDQTAVTDKEDATGTVLRNQEGKAIATSRLWLLPIDPTNPTAQSQPEALPLPGMRPRWLP